ncbi:DNA repair protein RadC [Candidatus Sumerlaeota bacterium]|nr:DNA repair protein RadC [Candidatus Sumerlaeota bacterium]
MVERIKACVLQGQSDALERVRAEFDKAGNQPPQFYKQKLLSVLFDIEDEHPAGRRKLRDLVCRLEQPPEELLDANAVSEEPAIYPARLQAENPWEKHPQWKRRDELRQTLAQFGASGEAQSPLIRRFQALENPRAIYDAARKELPSLSGLRVYRFLLKAGLPSIVPDQPRRTLLDRLNLVLQQESHNAWPERFFAASARLSHLSSEPFCALNYLLGVFSGAVIQRDFTPICTRRPRCHLCPVQQYCAYFRFHRADASTREGSKLLQIKASERPRERLMNQGAQALSDAEVLAILLRSGTRKLSVLELAQHVLDRFGSLARIEQAPIEEISQVPGIGPAKAAELKAAFEAGKRILREQAATPEMDQSFKIFAYCRSRLALEEQEQFCILLLNTKNRLIREIVATRGTLENSLVHPREAFKEAIRSAASAIVFVHNHPSGDPSPSREDIQLTERLVQSGKLLGIRVLDHIIVAGNNYYSFADRELL